MQSAMRPDGPGTGTGGTATAFIHLGASRCDLDRAMSQEAALLPIPTQIPQVLVPQIAFGAKRCPGGTTRSK